MTSISPRIGSREPLTYADAAFVAEVESAALLLSPLVSHHDPRSLLQAQSRVVYRTRRVLELTGQLKDLGNNVLLMGAGLTYHEALGLSYNVNIKNHELLWALLNFILSNDYDIDLFDSNFKTKVAEALHVGYTERSYTAVDPNPQIVDDEILNICPPGICIQRQMLTLFEFMNIRLGGYTSIIWNRAEPMSFFRERYDLKINPAKATEAITTETDTAKVILDNLFGRLDPKSKRQLLLTVGVGNSRQDVSLRSLFMESFGRASKQIGLDVKSDTWINGARQGIDFIGDDQGPIAWAVITNDRPTHHINSSKKSSRRRKFKKNQSFI